MANRHIIIGSAIRRKIFRGYLEFDLNICINTEIVINCEAWGAEQEPITSESDSYELSLVVVHLNLIDRDGPLFV